MMPDSFAAVLWIGLSALNVVLLVAVLVILLLITRQLKRARLMRRKMRDHVVRIRADIQKYDKKLGRRFDRSIWPQV